MPSKPATKPKTWQKKMWANVTTEGYITYGTGGRPHIYEKQPVPMPVVDVADRVIPVIVTIEPVKGKKK